MPRQKTPPGVEIRPLLDLGLTENEAVLYTLMIERAPSTVRELGSVSPFPRTLMYHVLGQLEQRGLVRSWKDGWRTVYVASDPGVLYDLLAHKSREAEREAEAARELIPRLKQHYLLAGQRPSVRIFEGVEEFEKALEDCLISGAKEICSFEQLSDRKPALESRQSHERRRILRKVRKNVLFFEDEKSLKHLAGRAYNDYTSYRGVGTNAVQPFEADVLLYSGKVLYTTSYGAHEPIAILIEDRALYQMQRNLFDALWRVGVDRTLYYTEVK